MAPRVELAVIVALALVTTLVQGAGQASPAEVTIGQDPSGDASSRVDVVAVNVQDKANEFIIELNLTAPYGATSSVMYAVHFTMWDTNATVCWNPQAVNQSVGVGPIRIQVINEELPEDVEGCNRFDDRTLVSPTVRETGERGTTHYQPGVEHGVDENGFGFVRWSVPKVGFGGGSLIGIQEVRAETYSRGVDAGGIGSDTIADLVWVRQDRAPDDGTWNHSFAGLPFVPPPPPPPPTEVALELPQQSPSVAAGNTASIPFGVSIDSGQTNITFGVDSAQPMAARFEPALLALTPSHPNGTTNLIFDVPADARGELVLQISAVSDTGQQATSELRVPVENPTLVAGAVGESPSAAPERDDGEPGRLKEVGPPQRDTPAPAAWLSLAALAAGLAMARRRRA